MSEKKKICERKGCEKTAHYPDGFDSYDKFNVKIHLCKDCRELLRQTVFGPEEIKVVCPECGKTIKVEVGEDVEDT